MIERCLPPPPTCAIAVDQAATGTRYTLVTEAGELVLGPVSPEGFQQTAKARVLKGTCYTTPSLAGGRLYLRSDQEMVCVLLKP